MTIARLTRTRLMLILAVAWTLSLMVVPPASAHSDLEASTPTEGATVSTLPEVSLTFSGPLLDIGSELSIVDAAGATHALEPELTTPDTVAAPVTGDLAPGAAQLVWRVVAEDGHPLEGVIDFTYAPEGSTPSASAAASPSTANATPAPRASEVPARPETTDDAASDTGVWLWLVPVVTVIGAVAFVVIRRRQRS